MSDTPHTAFALPAAMTIAAMEDVCAELKKLEPTPPALVLDAAATEILTTPGAQLLLSLAKRLEAGGVALSIINANATFFQALGQLGLSAQGDQWRSAHV